MNRSTYLFAAFGGTLRLGDRGTWLYWQLARDVNIPINANKIEVPITPVQAPHGHRRVNRDIYREMRGGGTSGTTTG